MTQHQQPTLTGEQLQDRLFPSPKRLLSRIREKRLVNLACKILPLLDGCVGNHFLFCFLIFSLLLLFYSSSCFSFHSLSPFFGSAIVFLNNDKLIPRVSPHRKKNITAGNGQSCFDNICVSAYETIMELRETNISCRIQRRQISDEDKH